MVLKSHICRNVLSAQKCFLLTLLRAGKEVMHESIVIEEEQAAMPGPSGTCATATDGWLTISDPTKAISQCADSFLRIHETKSPLLLSMDIRKSPAEQDMALISFYKRTNVEWGRPLNCKLEGSSNYKLQWSKNKVFPLSLFCQTVHCVTGDCAIGQGVTRFFFSKCMEKLKSGFCINFANSNVTRLFEGEPGHLVPSASHFLVESDMFMVAGRMVGHSFLHGGPCLLGLSPAVVHVLLGGSPETATVTLQDCPDLDIRETIDLLDGGSILSDKDKQRVQDLAHAWDLPCLTEKNRRWLFEKLLIHAVIGRVTRQIKQLRRGLKETPMWTLVTQRPDTVALLFPKEGAGNFSPEVLLQRLTWPHEDSDDDDDCSVDTKCRISGYLRQFIANATPTELTELVKFWTGWEIIPPSLSVEVVEGRYPTASTCFETLRIPGHYKDYTSFKCDILACIDSCHTGFGLV
ncbi:G2/M phase-specific E3 ubiquitin-protein ligase-like isoform X2 [Esox lucius]|uniref:G2/M phase-specific E3 ubiquitin-protein ligase-like isoform X2 n=1 Tax=Esox lucius TaxID=8010 RepID=UPI0014768271|nr:G2/M phase-specific E3 ubiquitin-protein ligase-like isoform X2 [Esox lucius]